MKNKIIIILLLVAPMQGQTDKNQSKSIAKDLLKAYVTHVTAVAAHQLTLYTLAKIALKLGAAVQPGQATSVDISVWPAGLGATVYPPEFQNRAINAGISAFAPLCALAGCALLGKFKSDKITNSVRYFHIGCNAIALLPLKVKELESPGYQIKKLFAK